MEELIIGHFQNITAKNKHMTDIETPNKEVGKDRITRLGMAQEEAMTTPIATGNINSRVEVPEQFWRQGVTSLLWYLSHIVRAVL